MGLFNKKIKVTFIDKEWNRIKDNVKVDAIPRRDELIYLGKEEDYYRVTQIVHWPSDNSKVFIVIESLSSLEMKLGGIITQQLIKDFNTDDIISWLFLIPIVGYNVLLTLHLIQRIRAEKKYKK